jgi:hypothetical protein
VNLKKHCLAINEWFLIFTLGLEGLNVSQPGKKGDNFCKVLPKHSHLRRKMPMAGIFGSKIKVEDLHSQRSIPRDNAKTTFQEVHIPDSIPVPEPAKFFQLLHKWFSYHSF